jgi:hypothetical protein
MRSSSSTTRMLPLQGRGISGGVAIGETGRATAVVPALGSSMRNVVPFPTALSTPMEPPARETILRTIESPRPVRPPDGFVVKKGSKMRAPAYPVDSTDRKM